MWLVWLNSWTLSPWIVHQNKSLCNLSQFFVKNLLSQLLSQNFRLSLNRFSLSFVPFNLPVYAPLLYTRARTRDAAGHYIHFYKLLLTPGWNYGCCLSCITTTSWAEDNRWCSPRISCCQWRLWSSWNLRAGGTMKVIEAVSERFPAHVALLLFKEALWFMRSGKFGNSFVPFFL